MSQIPSLPRGVWHLPLFRVNVFLWGLDLVRLQYFWRGSFWILLLIVLWLALVPADQLPSSVTFWDKAEHAVAFSALGILGLMAYPKKQWGTVAEFGALGWGP